MTTWNDKSYAAIGEKFRILENKPESVALAVWALSENRDMSAQDFRDLSEKTGVKVAGRAIGSAREIVGLKTPTKKRGRPKGSKNKRGPSGLADLHGILQTMKDMESSHAHMRKSLERIRDFCSQALR